MERLTDRGAETDEVISGRGQTQVHLEDSSALVQMLINTATNQEFKCASKAGTGILDDCG